VLGGGGETGWRAQCVQVMRYAGCLGRKQNTQGGKRKSNLFSVYPLEALHNLAPLFRRDLSPIKRSALLFALPTPDSLANALTSSQATFYTTNQVVLWKHHLQHLSQLCVMHIERCSVLTALTAAVGFESPFAITTPLCLPLLFSSTCLLFFLD